MTENLPSWDAVLAKAAAVSGVPAAELGDAFQLTGGRFERSLERSRIRIQNPRGSKVSRETFHEKRSPVPPKVGGKGSRRTRRARMSKRRARHEARSRALSARWNERLPDPKASPDVPAFKWRALARARKVAFDTSGRALREALVRVLPWGQAERLCGLALSASRLIRAGQVSRLTRADGRAKAFPTATAAELDAAAAELAAIASSSGWYRREVAAAVGLWGQARKLSRRERQSSRGGVYILDGFCQDALSHLIPRMDEGPTWSRSACWGSHGYFLMLGERPRRPGHAPGESGLGLFTRWQPPIDRARYKGKVRTFTNAAGVKVTEQWALAVLRYDAPMSGRTAWSSAQRGNPAARAFCKALCPWLFDQDDGQEAEPVDLREKAPEADRDDEPAEPEALDAGQPPERGATGPPGPH